MRKTVNIQGSVRVVEKIWLTRKQAAEYLGTSEEWIKKRNLCGDIRYSKCEGMVLMNIRDIDKYVESNRI